MIYWLNIIVPFRYAKFLTRFPYIIPLVVIGLAVGCGVYSWKKHPLPDFSSDPTKVSAHSELSAI